MRLRFQRTKPGRYLIYRESDPTKPGRTLLPVARIWGSNHGGWFVHYTKRIVDAQRVTKTQSLWNVKQPTLTAAKGWARRNLTECGHIEVVEW